MKIDLKSIDQNLQTDCFLPIIPVFQHSIIPCGGIRIVPLKTI